MEVSGDNYVNDDYSNIILPQTAFFTGNVLEHLCYNKTNQVFKVSNLITFFYGEYAVYPYAALQEHKKGLILENVDFAEIIKHVDEKYLTSFNV